LKIIFVLLVFYSFWSATSGLRAHNPFACAYSHAPTSTVNASSVARQRQQTSINSSGFHCYHFPRVKYIVIGRCFVYGFNRRISAIYL